MPSDAQIASVIGPPIHDAIPEVFHLEPELASTAISLFREYYRSEGLHEFSPYPGIDQLLRHLNARGFGLYVATSKPWVFAQDIIAQAGWEGLFLSIGGAELNGARSHKREVLRWVLDHRVSNEHIIAMIGDRVEDVSSASDLSLDCIGVSWGYSTREQLVDAGATAVVDSCEELRSLIASLHDFAGSEGN